MHKRFRRCNVSLTIPLYHAALQKRKKKLTGKLMLHVKTQRVEFEVGIRVLPPTQCLTDERAECRITHDYRGTPGRYTFGCYRCYDAFTV